MLPELCTAGVRKTRGSTTICADAVAPCPVAEILTFPADVVRASEVESPVGATVAICVELLAHENTTPDTGDPPAFRASALNSRLSPATNESSAGVTTTLATSETTVTLTFEVWPHDETLMLVVPTPRARTSPESVTTATEVSPELNLNDTSVRGPPRRFNAVSPIWTESLCRGGERKNKVALAGETRMLETGFETSQTPSIPVAVSPLHAMAAPKAARPSASIDRLVT